MKKLMVAAALVCAAVASEAATFQWSTDPAYMPYARGSIEAGEFNAATSGNTSRMQTWANNGATFLATIWISDDMGANWTKTENVAVKYGTGGYIATANISNAAFELPTTEGISKRLDWKIVIDGTYHDAAKGDFTMQSNEITGFKSYQMSDDSIINSAVPTKWTITAAAIPEPTSGLLLLLGIGAMALRRRRA